MTPNSEIHTYIYVKYIKKFMLSQSLLQNSYHYDFRFCLAEIFLLSLQLLQIRLGFPKVNFLKLLKSNFLLAPSGGCSSCNASILKKHSCYYCCCSTFFLIKQTRFSIVSPHKVGSASNKLLETETDSESISCNLFCN